MIVAVLWSAFISITQWLGHAYIQGEIEKKYSWLEFPKQRFVLTVISIVLYSFLAYGFVQVIMNWLVSGQSPIETMQVVLRQWSFPILISFGVSLITAAIGFFSGWKNSELKQEQLKAEMLEYKYEALKNQINPHFMFNSLNVLTELIYEDKEQAVEFIHKFSDIYRYVLDSRDKEIRPLKDEIAFIEKFVFLLKIRFEEKLTVEINLDIKKGQMIVPLAIQLLVENAVKHNEISSQHPLKITIKQEGECIVVQNSIQLKNNREESNGIGLRNLKSQYQYFSDGQVEVEETAELFTVKIPFIYED
jgi:sensor histidine kinase YesM